jgi:hypothetical protein
MERLDKRRKAGRNPILLLFFDGEKLLKGQTLKQKSLYIVKNIFGKSIGE